MGLYVQPKIGAWSDKIGKRAPFVAGLAIACVAGFIVLLAAAPVADSFANISPHAVVAAVFIGFGIADISLDCLLIPGR